MALDSIINLTITNTTVSVTQQGFGIPLILGYHTRFTDRFRRYSSLAAMVSDGFATTDLEYVAAAAVFAQNPRPVAVIVGRRLTKSAKVVNITPTAVNAAAYKITINGTTFTYTSDSSATVAEIVTGWKAVYDAAAISGITATDNTTYLTLTGTDTAPFRLSMEATNNAELHQQDVSTDGGWATDLGDLLAASKDWYAAIMTTHGKAEIIAAAGWAESNARLLLASTADYDVRTSGSGDLASSLKTSAYARTSLLWHHIPTSSPEAAWAGKLLPETPGAATWAYKTLAGIAASPTTPGNLTDTAIGILEGKRCNYYFELGGVNVTREGKVSSNEWLDIVIGLDWLKARIQERIYSRLVSLKKIPYTELGVSVITAEILGQLREAGNSGLLVPGTELVSFPPVSTISAADKGNRLLPSGTFSATLAGAIHSVNINGSVSV
jgi:hypothetical protein